MALKQHGWVGPEAQRVIQRIVSTAHKESGVPLASLARASDIHPETLRNKLKVGRFSVSELAIVATALGASLEAWMAEVDDEIARLSRFKESA